MSEDLENCPMCGEYAAVNSPAGIGYYVTECAHCGLRTDEYMDVTKANKAWNTRAYQANQAKIERLRGAVVILPEGAEPEVGDIWFCPAYDSAFSVKDILGIDAIRESIRTGCKNYCIQRQGKPVIYEQALAGDHEPI